MRRKSIVDPTLIATSPSASRIGRWPYISASSASTRSLRCCWLRGMVDRRSVRSTSTTLIEASLSIGCRSRLEHFRELVGSKEDRMLHAVDVA